MEKHGLYPKDWDKGVFGDLYEIQLGKMLSQKSTEGGEQLPYLANFNIRWDGFDTGIMRRMAFSEKERIKFRLKTGDLLVCEGGEVGRCSVWDERIQSCYYQKAVHRLRPKRHNLVHVFFTKCYLERLAKTRRISSIVGDSSIAHLTREKFISLFHPLPPFPEQKAIASVLQCWDKGVRQLEAKIAAKERVKKGLMQQLLSGQLRLSGFGEGKYLAVDELLAPSGWKLFKIEKILNIQYGKDWNSVADQAGEYPVYGTGGYMGQAKEYLFEGPAIVLGRKGTIDSPFYLEDPFWSVDTTFVFSPRSELILKYIYYKFLTINWKKYGEASGLPSLSRPTISQIDLLLPPLEEQKAIVRVLSAADRELDALRRKLEAWKTQKKYLLNNLVDGSIRLPEFADAAKEVAG